MHSERIERKWEEPSLARRRRPIAYRPIQPDGGWGWMVVFGAFLIHVFADGFVYSFGIMVVELLETFHEGRSLTSWIISLLTGLTLGVGPIASAVTNRFGCRVTTITGACIASFGCFISYFANSILFLMISVGLVMGFGFGLMYCPAIVIVTMYFEERRAFATGIAVCGAGIGTFIFAPLSNYLIELYTWRGAFLIYSGLIMNCAVCGAMFRPLEFEAVYADDDDDELRPAAYSALTDDSTDHVKIRPDVGETAANGFGGEQRLLLQQNGVHVVVEPAYDAAEDARRQLDLSDERIKAFSHTHLAVGEPPDGQLYRTSSIQGGVTQLPQPFANGDGHLAVHRRRGISESSGYLSIKDVFYAGSVTHIPQFRADPDRYRSIASVHEHFVKEELQGEAQALGDGGRMVTTVSLASLHSLNGWDDALKVLREMADFSLLKDPMFLLFAVSNFLTSVGFNAPLIFLPDRAENELHMSKTTASWILSAFGVANTLGRVVIGFVGDRPLGSCRLTSRPVYNRLWIYNVSITICGVFTVISALCTTFTQLVIYSACFGFTLSCYVCLTSVLLVDLVGLEKLTNGFGILLLFQGLATLIGPPIAGWLVDSMGSYDGAFYFSGVGIFLSGVMLYCIPCFRPLPVSGRRAEPMTALH